MLASEPKTPVLDVLADGYGVDQHRLEAAINDDAEIRSEYQRITRGDATPETVDALHGHVKQWILGER